MGFLDYATKISLQRDRLRVKLLVHPNFKYATLIPEAETYTLRFPEPKISDENIEFLGYNFPPDNFGKTRTGRLFRAMVSHITSHTVKELPLILESQSQPARFTNAIIRDLYVDAYMGAEHPERLADLAYANALATASIKRLDNVFLSATRVMAALLSKVFGGRLLEGLSGKEATMVAEAAERLKDAKESLSASLGDGVIDVEGLRETAEWLVGSLRDFGPFVEVPLLPHTENISSCRIFSEQPTEEEVIEQFFLDAVKAIDGEPPENEGIAACWDKSDDVEYQQAFSTRQIERAKEEKFLNQLEERLQPSRFKSIEVPPEDYTEYLRAREQIGGAAKRLLNNVIQATNFEFEDIRKKYGVLDLQDAIQVVANKSERSDVFMRDMLMKQSYAIVVLLDVSRSMRASALENRARAVCLAEAAEGVVSDSDSCAFYAFSDRLYVLKDGSETFSRVRSRIGGVPFEGNTYMPEALEAAADFLRGQGATQRLIIILSDGSPFGYSNIYESLKETNQTNEERGVVTVGIGLNTKKMEPLFKHSTAVYSQKDLIKKVGSLFIQAAQEELT
jgi:hypothetical protein